MRRCNVAGLQWWTRARGSAWRVEPLEAGTWLLSGPLAGALSRAALRARGLLPLSALALKTIRF